MGGREKVPAPFLSGQRNFTSAAGSSPNRPIEETMTGADPDGRGSLGKALANGHRLLSIDPRAAIEQAREILQVDSANGDALRLLAAALRRLGRNREADQAERDATTSAADKALLVEASRAIDEKRLSAAEHVLRPYLQRRPDDADAIAMLAEVAAGARAIADAERLFRRALELAPGLASARHSLSILLFRENRLAEALTMVEHLVLEDQEDLRALNSKAFILARIGEYEEAIAVYERLIQSIPDQPSIWTRYGDVLKTSGRAQDSIAAYRRATELDPKFGEAWWGLANLKTLSLSEEDIPAMELALQAEELDESRLLHLHFAAGKALEDLGRTEESFAHYAEGNRIRRAMLPYDPTEVKDHVQRSEILLTKSFFAERAGRGSSAADPIFILGMPRAGSTLIEQILSSHPLVEGTSELPYIPTLALAIAARDQQSSPLSYLEALAGLSAAELRSLGEEYIRSAAAHRKTDRPYFIDKLPNNWEHIGLINLILPNARIIDARRHPLACCFSNFKQHFAQGQAFSYVQEDIALHYKLYVRLLRHFDTMLPGRIIRVTHEAMVQDSEAEIRRLLALLDLPFDAACLRFHENERAVRTPSAEQVRRPINRDGLDQWRAYEPWLEPMKRVLGSVLTCYPDTPSEIVW